MIRKDKGPTSINDDVKPSWMRDLLTLAADWIWEQDASLRFTRLEGGDVEASGSSEAVSFLGKRRWETGLQIDAAGGWEEHRARLAEHEVFRDVRIWREMPDGKRRHAVISGVSIFDEDGRFAGYRGIGKVISSWQLGQDDLRLFQRIIDAS